MKLTDLIPDDRNANKGTKRGSDVIRTSLAELGAGRSILIDRDGRVIAGNKTLESAKAVGVEDVLVIPTDGSKIIAVQRTDLSLDDEKGRKLAIADNRSSDLSLDWDEEVLAQLSAEFDLKPFFTDKELADIIAPDRESTSREVDVDGFVFGHKCPKCGFEFNDD